MEYVSLYSANKPPKDLEKSVKGTDNLSSYESGYRNELADAGIIECRELIGKQKSSEMYYFYEGSIDGFEECKKYSKLSDFEKRLKGLEAKEHREISCSSLKDKELREMLGIYDDNEETDINEVWKMKGIRTQVEYVYEGLLAFRTMFKQR